MLSATSASYSLVLSMVSPALETIRISLHTDQFGISWVLTAYLLSGAMLTPIVGRLGDRYGKKQLLIGALGVLVIGSLVSASALTLPVMIVGRVLQGAGGAVLPLAFGLIRDNNPAHKVGSSVGIVAATSSVGGGIGVVIAGPIVESLGVHWLFLLPAIANAVIAVVLLFVIPAGARAANGGVNWLAALLLSAALVCLLLPLSLGSQMGWLSVNTLLLFAGAIIFGALWVLVELRAKFPLIDMRVFRLRPVWTANLASLLVGVGLYSAMGFIPSFLQVPRGTGYGLGATATQSGLLFVPTTLAMLITGLLAGPLTRALRPKTVLILGAIPPIISFGLLAFAREGWEIVVAIAIGGLGFGVALSALSAVVVHAVPASQTGAAAGMNANIRTIGGAIGAAIFASILGSHQGALGFPTGAGYTIAFTTLGVAGVLSLLACIIIPARGGGQARRARQEDTEELRADELLDQHSPF